MKKVKIPTNEGIDWSKPQWVFDLQSNMVILTSGNHEGDFFEGTAMPCHGFPSGEWSQKWTKCFYQPLTFDIPFTISNSNNED